MRFGDVVQGLHQFSLEVETIDQRGSNGVLKMESHRYYAVVTPCCSIEGKSVLLCPLVPVDKAIFKMPYLKDDLVRINHYIEPQKAILPQRFEKMAPEEKQEIIERPPSYVYVNYFIYKEHDLFQEYDVDIKKGIKSRYYMIDFKNAFRFGCAEISRKKIDYSGFKVLQLTIESREHLRHKMSEFYGRVPDEDREAVELT